MYASGSPTKINECSGPSILSNAICHTEVRPRVSQYHHIKGFVEIYKTIIAYIIMLVFLLLIYNTEISSSIEMFQK